MADQGVHEGRIAEISDLLDLFNCGLLATDAERDVVFVNARLREWLGYEIDEVVGRPAIDLVPEEVRPLLIAERESLDRGDIRARLMVLQRKNSTTFPAIALPQVLFDADGRFAGGLMVFVELATIETAKPLGGQFGTDLRSELHRIALQIQSLGLTANTGTLRLPLEHPVFSDLTDRESEVLAHLVSGDRVPAIARKLFISPHTVRNHLKGIFRKVGVGSQTALLERVREASGGEGS